MEQGFIDCHLHMSDSSFNDYEGINGAVNLFSCSANLSDWNKLEYLSKNDERIIPFFGLHPWFINEQLDISKLDEILEKNPHAGVGEIGLDTTKPYLDLQKNIFIEQLESAIWFERPVNIHMVKCEEMMLPILKEHNGANVIIHSFKGPTSYIKAFTEVGCYFSLSPNILSMSEQKLSDLVKSIPSERLLIETDAPNNHQSIFDLIDKISNIIEMDNDQLISLTTNNARRLIP